MDKLVASVEEAAAALGVHPLTLRRAIARGELPHVRVGVRILIPLKALDEFLESRTLAKAAGGG
jgi:excisionase family DNA binding protein